MRKAYIWLQLPTSPSDFNFSLRYSLFVIHYSLPHHAPTRKNDRIPLTFSLNFYFNFLLQLPLPCSLFHIHTAPSPMLRGRFPCVSPLKIFACSRKILSLRKPRGSLNSFHFTFSLNFYFNYLLQFPLPCSLLVVSLSNHSLFILPLWNLFLPPQILML